MLFSLVSTIIFLAVFILAGLADKYLRIGFIERFIANLPNADEDRR